MITTLRARAAGLFGRLREIFRRLWRRRAYYINGPETLPAPLSKEEEKIVFRKLEENDEGAKETLTVHNLRLVVYIAKKFENRPASAWRTSSRSGRSG